jgi:hypothetical protein
MSARPASSTTRIFDAMSTSNGCRASSIENRMRCQGSPLADQTLHPLLH